jgi:hypothetical protein
MPTELLLGERISIEFPQNSLANAFLEDREYDLFQQEPFVRQAVRPVSKKISVWDKEYTLSQKKLFVGQRVRPVSKKPFVGQRVRPV